MPAICRTIRESYGRAYKRRLSAQWRPSRRHHVHAAPLYRDLNSLRHVALGRTSIRDRVLRREFTGDLRYVRHERLSGDHVPPAAAGLLRTVAENLVEVVVALEKIRGPRGRGLRSHGGVSGKHDVQGGTTAMDLIEHVAAEERAVFLAADGEREDHRSSRLPRSKRLRGVGNAFEQLTAILSRR